MFDAEIVASQLIFPSTEFTLLLDDLSQGGLEVTVIDYHDRVHTGKLEATNRFDHYRINGWTFCVDEIQTIRLRNDHAGFDAR